MEHVSKHPAKICRTSFAHLSNVSSNKRWVGHSSRMWAGQLTEHVEIYSNRGNQFLESRRGNAGGGHRRGRVGGRAGRGGEEGSTGAEPRRQSWHPRAGRPQSAVGIANQSQMHGTSIAQVSHIGLAKIYGAPAECPTTAAEAYWECVVAYGSPTNIYLNSIANGIDASRTDSFDGHLSKIHRGQYECLKAAAPSPLRLRRTGIRIPHTFRSGTLRPRLEHPVPKTNPHPSQCLAPTYP